MSKEMKQYLQHKIVQAERIEAVADDEPDKVTLLPGAPAGDPVSIEVKLQSGGTLHIPIRRQGP